VGVSGIYVHGLGAVSPAGWGTKPLREAMCLGNPPPVKDLARPGWEKPLRVRPVPPPESRPSFAAHARLRRTSLITQYAVAAALEALGDEAAKVAGGSLRLGIVLCAMSGCVNYSRRFYDEVLRDPATASPLVFPETVFNAPASHLAALLGTPAMNYTLVGDPSVFLQGVALGAQWLADGRVDGCLIVGAEECDWLTSDAFHLFSRQIILSDGAGALYLKAHVNNEPIELRRITEPHLFTKKQTRAQAALRARNDLLNGASLASDFKSALLIDGLQNVPRVDAAEAAAWGDWAGTRLSPKMIFGEGLMAAAAWQCVLAVEALREGRCVEAVVSIVGCNQQAVAARFGNSRM
jgi:3-oxoacyl-(acyl-carrier-protein) synthase